MKAGTHEIWSVIFAIITMGAMIYFVINTEAVAAVTVLLTAIYSAEHGIIAEIKRKEDE